MTESPPAAAPYRVLARKYRPTRFADLIGQEAMVRTLTNAIAAGRLAHAFVLTGVRGVGKTTTARILARVLNCVGLDCKGGPTADPCGVCEHCTAIAEDRHMDVIEMDAASRTGVDDVRELIDGVRYRPVSARYKVYIVDEVHMLSKNAFNALLKTLEEPPEHVKFVFATTEIRKVPVTVLSRCQRFDLRRIDQAALADYLAAIAGKEGRKLAPAAAALLARAADGSARDGLSLLDRALAHAESDTAEVDESEVRGLLGLADRTQIFDLFEALMKGEAAPALARIAEMYRGGADPLVVLQDLLEVTHWLTRLKVAPDIADDPTVPEAERARGRDLVARLGMPALARSWQMLLKGLAEVQAAPQPLAALEMLAVRLTYAAELPSPAELAADLSSNGGGSASPAGGGRPGRSGGAVRGEGVTVAAGTPLRSTPSGNGQAQARLVEASPAVSPEAMLQPRAADPQGFAEVAALFETKREGVLHAHLLNNVHLVAFEPGRIEFRPTVHAPKDLASRLMALLEKWTGRRWIVAISGEAGAPTLAEQATTAREASKAAAATHPLVRAVLDAFPGAAIEAVRGPAAPASDDTGADAAAEGEAIPDLSEPEDM
ncbi:MAG: DNA polymerase III subunit gamma/tau [Rhodospirillales bacterium]|nr:DNA polymerase III subunit gamma/tau [Rhodospirillales bacterium]